MATTFYIRNTFQTVPISPSADGAWEVTTNLLRVLANTAKTSDALTTVSITETSSTDKDITVRQLITPLAGGQTITGGQAIKCQCRVSETTTGNNMFLALGIRVIANDGITVRKTILALTRDDIEAPTALTNRQFTATSTIGSYPTVDGDYLVFELGMGGDPSGSNPHNFSMRLGDSSATNLLENDIATADDNPWISLADSLTVGVSTAAGSSIVTSSANASGTGLRFGAGQASGLASVTGTMASSAVTSGSSSAIADATGFIGNLRSRIGTASGLATVQAVGIPLMIGTGTAAAVSEASAVAATVALTIGQAVASSLASAFGPSGGGIGVLPGTRLRFAYELFDDDPFVFAAIPGLTGAASAIVTVLGVSAATKASQGAAAASVTVVGHTPTLATSGTRLRFAYELFDDDVFAQTLTTQSTTGSAAATASVVGFTAVVQTATASATGLVTVLGVFATRKAAQGIAAGISTVVGFVNASSVAAGTASASSTVIATAASTSRTVGNASGASVASATGAATTENQGVGSAAGSALALGISTSGATTVGTIAATSSVNGAVRVTAEIVGAAVGIAEALAIASPQLPSQAVGNAVAFGAAFGVTGITLQITGLSSALTIVLGNASILRSATGFCAVESEAHAHGRRPGASDDVPKNAITLARITSKTTMVRDLTLTPTHSDFD